MAVSTTPRSKKSSFFSLSQKKTKSNREAAKKCRDKKNRAHEELKKWEASLKKENAMLKVERECLCQQIRLLEEIGVEKDDPTPVSAKRNESAGLVVPGNCDPNSNQVLRNGWDMASGDCHYPSHSLRGYQKRQVPLYPLLLNGAGRLAPSRKTLLQTQVLAASNSVQQQPQAAFLNQAAVPGVPQAVAPIVLGGPAVLSLLSTNNANIHNNANGRGHESMLLYR